MSSGRRAKRPTRRPHRRRWYRSAWLPLVLLAGLLGGYVGADIADAVPGVLTTRPEPIPDPPYPQQSNPAAPVVAVAGPDAGAAIPEPAQIESLVATLLADPLIGPGAGVLVSDVLTGTELGAANADVAQTPASNTKLLTAAAAIATAGPDYRFRTTVVNGGDGQIVLVGGGDLALAAGAGDPGAIVGHAGVADLAAATAAALQASGTTSVTLGLDTSYYAGPALAPRWDGPDLANGDAMAMTPLAIDVGRREGTRSRDTDAGGTTAAVFVQALTTAGITVTGQVQSVQAATDATELAAVESARLEDLAADMLQRSENILAEGIGRLVAHQLGMEPSFEGAGTAVGAALADLGVDVGGLFLADCAGLSSTNQISARTLVQTLLQIAARPSLASVARGLPVAGLEGTLKDRFDGVGAGLVNAKTGTLYTVTALSGYVRTADGRLLAFAVMADNVPRGSTTGARSAVDGFAQGLAACGCGSS
ncbi:MAG: D-alanyl-D-alanine carboxypeptidase/D-alanyl-D-alanine-endopeptidase [Beutenbergiaceae bacterium]